MTAGPIGRNRSSRNGPVACWAFPDTIAAARQRTVAAVILIGGMRTLMLAGTPSLRRVDEHTILLPHDAVLDDVDDMRQRDDVEERIAVDDDDVRELAGLDRSQLTPLARRA